MPRIRCHYIDCVFLDDGFCGAAAIEIDPDLGCQTNKRSADPAVEDEWDDEDELEEWVELDEDDLWLDDDDEF